MTHQPHSDLDLPRTTMPRRRVFQSLAGATLALAGLTGCGGGSEEEDEDDNEAGAEDEEGNEEENGGDQEADD